MVTPASDAPCTSVTNPVIAWANAGVPALVTEKRTIKAVLTRCTGSLFRVTDTGQQERYSTHTEPQAGAVKSDRSVRVFMPLGWPGAKKRVFRRLAGAKPCL